MLASLEQRFGRIEAIQTSPPTNGPGNARAPADRFRLPDGATFGIISSADQLEATLTKPVDAPGANSAWPLRFSLRGDLATWRKNSRVAAE